MLQWWRASFLVTVFLAAALGNWNDTLTGIDLDKVRQFPLSKIQSGWLKDGSRVTFAGITATAATADEREVRLRGTGKSGKQWEAHIFGLDEVWRADLDANGTQDYVFFAGGPYFNGRTTPLFSLSILLMDGEGMPVPFFTVVYKGENGDGIKHLVDLNHDGHAELIISSYDEEPSDPHAAAAFCSGHWVSQLLQFRNFGAEEIRGQIAGMTFPFIHDWSYGEKECGHNEGPNPIRPPTISEHGTSMQEAVITKIRKKGDADGRFAIDPVRGCKTVSPSVVVYDRSQVREIASPNQFGNYSSDLANNIQRDGARVELRGINKWMGNGDCSVNLIWAK